jgi:hypothetical protein
MPASVVVAGALANKPGNGGEAWVRLSYILGLQRLRCHVAFIETIEKPSPHAVEFFRRTTERYGIGGSSALVEPGGKPILGSPKLRADLLLNVSGNLCSDALRDGFGRTAYVDIDPGYTQAWHEDATLPISQHDVYFTIAENLGQSDCTLPMGRIEWQATRPPVVLEEWPVARSAQRGFTTVATWRAAYGRLEYGGRTYGVKLDEFRKVLPLPKTTGATFELALDIHADERQDRAALRANNWGLVTPPSDPDSFRSYVQGSGAEFSVAQGVYVETRSGWFSDRTTRYLASGKPALVQDTGFGRKIPTGEGLLTFRTLEEAAAGVEAISADYEHHAAAARRVAEECFDSDAVLTRLLEDALK